MNSTRPARPRRSAVPRPERRISPSVGVSSPRIMRASVVLPEPDSLTMVKTSGCFSSIAKLASTTASTWVREKMPPMAKRL